MVADIRKRTILRDGDQDDGDNGVNDREDQLNEVPPGELEDRCIHRRPFSRLTKRMPFETNLFTTMMLGIRPTTQMIPERIEIEEIDESKRLTGDHGREKNGLLAFSTLVVFLSIGLVVENDESGKIITEESLEGHR